MNTSVPWSIKDISFETREAAKEAARRAGVSLGEWLDTIIAERASERGVPQATIDNQERLDAVAAELSRLAARQPAARARFETDEAYAATGTYGLSSSARTQSASSWPVDDPLRIMSERLADFERRALSSRVTDRAIEFDDRAAAMPARSRPGRAGKPMSLAVRDAVAEISRRQAALDDEARDEAAPAAKAAPATQSGQDAFPPGAEDLASRRRAAAPEPGLDDVGREARDPAEPVPARPGRQADEPEASVAHIAEPAASAAPFRSNEAFEDLKRDLRQAIKDIDPRNSVEDLDRHVREMERKIEGIGAIFPPSTVLSEIDDRTRDMQDMLTAAAARPTGSDALQRQVADLQNRMGELTALQRAAPTEPEGWSEVRTLLGRVPSDSSFDTLDRRLQDLAAKIDMGLGDASPTPLLKDLSRRIDEIQASIKLPRDPSVDTGPLEALVRGIADRIEDTRLASANNQHLEHLVGALAAKIETGQAPVNLRALETQIDRLGHRLERSEASLSALDTVEHALGELFTQLEETRHAAIDAAENAARTAARDTLRAAMQNQPTPVADMPPGIVEQVGQILNEVRQQHDASDRRTQSTLVDLHQTMEKLVEHLAKLDVAGRPFEADPSRDPPLVPSPEVLAGDRDKPRVDRRSAPSVQADSTYQDRFRQDQVNRRAVRTEDAVDSLIEPGAGRSFRDAGPDEALAARRSAAAPAEPAAAARDIEGPAAYIAAARRAAQASQASAAAQKQPKTKSVLGQGDPRASAGAPVLERARRFLVQRRRPILLSLAGLVLLLGALEVVKVGFEETSGSAANGAAKSSTSAPAPLNLADAHAPAGQDATAAASPGQAAANPDPTATAKADVAFGKPPRIAGGSPDASAASGDSHPLAGRPVGSNPFLAGLATPEGTSEGVRKLAVSGDPAAQYELGLRYAEGRTLNRDPKAAEAWFEKAAAQGLAPAQYRTGSAYEKGIGVTRDPASAMAWYGRAAEAGNIKAMHNLAVMAADGSTGKSDYAKAATWFSKAATFGVRDSQFNLAILYAKGLGIEQSLTQSYTWFAIAAAQGDDDAGKKRDEVGTKLDAKTLAAAKAAADAFHPAASISAANDVTAPPGGWDALTPTSHTTPSPQKGAAPKVSTM